MGVRFNVEVMTVADKVRTGKRGRVARMAAQAAERGWRLLTVDHDRCLTASEWLAPGVLGRLLLTRTGAVILEVEASEGEKVIDLATVPTPAEAAVAW